MSVESLNAYAATSRIDLADGVAMALVHPHGETPATLAGGPYLAAFASGSPRCHACRELDGQQALTASKDRALGAGQDVDLATARAEVAARAAQDEAGEHPEREAYEQALRQMDTRTASAVAAFLEAAVGIEVSDIATSRKWVPKRKFGLYIGTGGYQHTYMKAHVICVTETKKSPVSETSDRRVVYVLPDGRVQFLQHSHYPSSAYGPDIPEEFRVDVEKRDFGDGTTQAWTRKTSGPGLLPFHIPPDQNPEPGVPRMSGSFEECERTATWFIRVLAEYLETQQKRAGAV
jgi:hypothetical protein